MTASETTERAELHVPSTVAAALGVGLFLETLRLWFPAVAYIYGRAGSTDPLQLGAFALAPFLLAFLVVPLVRSRGARTVLLAGGGTLVAARLIAQAASGGDVQLWATTVGALAGLMFVAAAAAGGLARAPLAVGLAAGLAVDAGLEALLGGSSLDWQTGAVGVGWALTAWAVLLVFVGAFGSSLLRSRPAEPVLTTRGAAWLLLGPVLALHLVLGGLQPPLVALTTDRIVGGSSTWVVAGVAGLLVVGAYALSVRYAFEARPHPQRAWLTPLLALLAAAGALALQGEPVVLAIQLLLIVVLGLAAAAIPTTAGRSTPARHAAAAAGGALLLFLLVFPYYASYDLPLGVPSVAFLGLGAVGLAVGLYRTGRRGTHVGPVAAAGPARSAAAITVVALAAGAVVGVRAYIPDTADADGFPLRVALANLHMGFSTDGAYVGPAQGELLASAQPDVTVLNEVDRGWALNGGQDLLRDVARELRAPYVFTPAADDVWGNAIVSRYPILETGSEILPDSGGYMVRSALWVVLDLGDGRELAVVGTHLHHRGEDASIRRPQAQQVAEIAAGLSTGGRPVVVAGDLNAQPGTPDIAPLEARFRHTAAGTPPATYPSSAPERAIDHVLVTPDLEAIAYDVTATDLSDHAWVAVTVTPAGG